MDNTEKQHDSANPSLVTKVVGHVATAGSAAFHVVNQTVDAARYSVGRLDAVDMLIKQHREAVLTLEKAIAIDDPSSRWKLFALVADALLMHMRIEEEIFYPMLEKEGRSKKPLIDHAENEHHEAKMIIADLLALDAGDALFLSKLQELTADIKHHIEEEEREILPAAEKEMDDHLRRKIGEAMHERMAELHKLEKPRELALQDTGKGKVHSG
jgi:hypothetical protein